MDEGLRGLTIFGDLKSGNCWKVRWVATLCKVPFEWVDIDVVGGECQSRTFASLNPAGKVPFARFGNGRSLPESNAIMLYLAEATGSPLLPKDLFQRAQMMSWLFWEQYTHEPAIAVRRYRKMFLGMSEDELGPELLEKGNAALTLMEQQLSATEYLVGDALTLADIALVAYTRWAEEGGFDLSLYPGVTAWLTRVLEQLPE